MKVSGVQESLRERPFRPFDINLPEGRTVHVFHPDFALLSPDGRTLLAYERDNSFHMIDVALITNIRVGPASAANVSPAPNTPSE
jgi:hypothetical protein